MSLRAFAAAALAAAITTAAGADAIDPCSLVTDDELVELGLPNGSLPSRESQPGDVQACRYRSPASAVSDVTVSIMLSQAAPERALQFRVLQAKAREEGTPAQQQARGEFFEGDVLCKLVSASGQETSQCMGASERSVVALAVSRPNRAHELAYPASQLRIMGILVSRAKLADR